MALVFYGRSSSATQESGLAAQIERAKALGPSFAIDIALGLLFFFVAREFGLLTAALAGSAATVVLFGVQRFVKTDLLGGFAAFGVMMALISALLAMIFQDDTFVKLRGSLMGLVFATFALADGLCGGAYLGKRLALYMSWLGRIAPKRAAFGMAGAGAAILVIELPLVFLLSTSQWIWYTSFFDSFVTIPVMIAAMLWARGPVARSVPPPQRPDAGN